MTENGDKQGELERFAQCYRCRNPFLIAKERPRPRSYNMKSWRACLFHPGLWNRLDLKLNTPQQMARAQFLATKCAGFARELSLEWPHDADKVDETCRNIIMRKALAVLKMAKNNRNLEKFCLKCCGCDLLGDSQEDEDIITELQYVISLILSGAKNLKYLSFGYCVEIFDSSTIQAVAKSCGQSLHTLHAATLYPEEQAQSLFTHPTLQSLRQLQVLSLDFEELSNEILSVMCNNGNRAPLQNLILLQDGEPVNLPNIRDRVWHLFAASNPDAEVTLTLLRVPSGLGDYLSPSMPLGTLRALYCGEVDRTSLDFVSRHHCKTLRSLTLCEWMDCGATYSLIPDNAMGEDPLVMLAWRCTNLTNLSIIGYEFSKDSLVAVARLRGSQLRSLEVSVSCIVETDDDDDEEEEDEDEVILDDGAMSMDTLRQQVSESLGWSWAPAMYTPDISTILLEDLQVQGN
ncbi:PREDICTED: F-box only protein 33-like [Branchiostoma belcheri]|uniref:F-box only protein 33-like n=1 Tax=Branchiostoma belcheri TaxID=7741 RepID=A0A6P4ZY56_BRABE|nr:PREDICTED: F-box only protein 33-like [Branchiostoma belcheri]